MQNAKHEMRAWAPAYAGASLRPCHSAEGRNPRLPFPLRHPIGSWDPDPIPQSIRI